MGKAIVVFGPAAENTQALAEYAADGLKKGGIEVTLKNVIDADIDELEEYDTVVLFCSTKAANEKQDSPFDLHADLNDILIAGKKGAICRHGYGDQYPEIISELPNLRRAA